MVPRGLKKAFNALLLGTALAGIALVGGCANPAGGGASGSSSATTSTPTSPTSPSTPTTGTVITLVAAYNTASANSATTGNVIYPTLIYPTTGDNGNYSPSLSYSHPITEYIYDINIDPKAKYHFDGPTIDSVVVVHNVVNDDFNIEVANASLAFAYGINGTNASGNQVNVNIKVDVPCLTPVPTTAPTLPYYDGTINITKKDPLPPYASVNADQPQITTHQLSLVKFETYASKTGVAPKVILDIPYKSRTTINRVYDTFRGND